MTMLNLRQREYLRRRYRPEQVRLLFVGESPPASGRFFYRGDSGLYRAMRDTFQTVDPSMRDESFFATFRDAGCYLVDLCPEPIDRLDLKSRRAACRNAEASFSKAMARLRPSMVATLVRSIEGNVLSAASLANWQGTMIHLPYPGRWSHLKQSFVKTLAPVIADLESFRCARRDGVSTGRADGSLSQLRKDVG